MSDPLEQQLAAEAAANFYLTSKLEEAIELVKDALDHGTSPEWDAIATTFLKGAGEKLTDDSASVRRDP